MGNYNVDQPILDKFIHIVRQKCQESGIIGQNNDFHQNIYIPNTPKMFRNTRTKSEQEELMKVLSKHPSPPIRNKVLIAKGLWVVPNKEFSNDQEKQLWIERKREQLGINKRSFD